MLRDKSIHSIVPLFAAMSIYTRDHQMLSVKYQIVNIFFLTSHTVWVTNKHRCCCSVKPSKGNTAPKQIGIIASKLTFFTKNDERPDLVLGSSLLTTAVVDTYTSLFSVLLPSTPAASFLSQKGTESCRCLE